ncbi:MAG: hypothetical protein MUE58_12435 [Chitinophagaceae bacterium]|jgi:hypothetical protein|nr:hypothetical protein [Chitinophagaceae bacterium]
MRLIILLLSLISCGAAFAQDADALLTKVKSKMDQVRDYKAQGSLKTDVSFLKIPVSRVQVLYKNPDRFRIQKDGGISLLPKGGISVNLNALMATGQFVAVSSGEATIGGQLLRIIKMLPLEENSDLILSTLYIDEKSLLIRRAVTTTRGNGTYEMDMQYGKYASLGLPDKVVVSFDTRDYKLPKGVTFEYEAGNRPVEKEKDGKPKKGRVEITYAAYQVNLGLTEAAFK